VVGAVIAVPAGIYWSDILKGIPFCKNIAKWDPKKVAKW